MSDKATDDPINFVRMIVTKITRGRVSIQEFEDMVGDGLIGLVDARNKYDPSKANGGKFSTYAEWRIRGAIIDSTRQRLGRKGQKNIVDLYEPQSKEDTRTIEDAAAEYSDPLEQLIVSQTLSTLSEREQQVINLLLQGYSREEIGDHLLVTEAHISQINSDIHLQLTGELPSKRESIMTIHHEYNRDPIIVERQLRVKELLAQNKTHQEIANLLHIKRQTVSNDCVAMRRRTQSKPPKQLSPIQSNQPIIEEIDFRDQISHLLRKNLIPKEKINLIINIIDL